nr:MAG TPA: hypothetical protein [Microviridae sp.]
MRFIGYLILFICCPILWLFLILSKEPKKTDNITWTGH